MASAATTNSSAVTSAVTSSGVRDIAASSGGASASARSDASASSTSSASPFTSASSASECVMSLMSDAYFVKRSVMSFPKPRLRAKIRAIMMINVVNTTEV